MKHSFPFALELCNLPLTITSFPWKELSISSTFVSFLMNLYSGSPYDLLRSLSPNKWALGSFGFFLLSSIYATTFYYLFALIIVSIIIFLPSPSKQFIFSKKLTTFF